MENRKSIWQQYSKTKRWWNILLDVTLLVLIILMLIPSSRKSISSFVIKRTMLSPREQTHNFIISEKDWNFQIRSSNGEIFKLSDFNDKPIFINLFATWCPPCIAEMPSLQNLYDTYKDVIHFIFISYESSEIIENYFMKKNLTLPTYQYVSPLPEIFDKSTLPTTIIINQQGQMVYIKSGANRWDSSKAFNLINQIIE